MRIDIATTNDQVIHLGKFQKVISKDNDNNVVSEVKADEIEKFIPYDGMTYSFISDAGTAVILGDNIYYICTVNN
jgi:hypothetical protein